MKKTLLCAALAAGLAAPAGAADGFAKSVLFTTSGYRGSAPLADFPVLVRLSPAIEGFDYADFGAGTNLLFRASGGAILPHEVDAWDTNGTSFVWVRVPSVAAETTFTMYYDGASDAAADPAAVWSGAGYAGVWHMNEASGAVADATGHGLAAAPAGDAAGIAGSARYAGADAPVGHARQTGTSAAKGYLSVPSYDALAVGDAFTMSGWVRLTENVANSPRLFSRKASYSSDNGWEIEMATASPANFNVRGAARDRDTCMGTFEPSLRDRWTHVAFAYDGSTCTVYTNGFALVSGAVTPATDNGLPLAIGCDSDGTEATIRGAFDECRLLGAAASADWIAAEYATVADPAFLSASAVVSDAPAIGTVSVAAATSRATISGSILSLGMGGATRCDVYLAFGTSPAALGPSRKIASYATSSFKCTIPDLWARTTYYYEISVTNNATPAAGSSKRGSFTTEAPFDFQKKVSFSVARGGAEGLDGLPVLVRLSEGSPEGFSHRHCAEGGSDLIFTDADGREIPFEIDSWDAQGESLVWVRPPSLAEGATLTMFFRGTPASGADGSGVWSEYAGVWHLNGLGADDAALWQSQGLYPNSTATPGLDAHLSTNSVPGQPGRFGQAFRVNDAPGWKQGGHNEGGAWVDDAGEGSPLDAGGAFTISGWFRHADWNYNYGKLFFKRLNANNSGSPAGAFATQLGSGAWDNLIDAYGSGANRVRATTDFSLRDAWVHLTFVFDGKLHTVYTNGAVAATQNYRDAVVDNDAPLVFGNNAAIAAGQTGDCAWAGLIDEVRYLRSARSADWIAAEYAAMADAGFLVAGAVENVVKPTIIIVR